MKEVGCGAISYILGLYLILCYFLSYIISQRWVLASSSTPVNVRGEQCSLEVRAIVVLQFSPLTAVHPLLVPPISSIPQGCRA